MALLTRVLHSAFSKTIGNSIAVPRCTIMPLTRLASTETSAVDFVDEDVMDEKQLAAAAMEAKRNKSRLKPKHYKLLHGEIPVDPQNPYYPYESKVAYRQRLAARYGQSSGVNQGIAWPTKRELDEMIEYEKVAHPFTLQEMVEKKKKQREEEAKKIQQRQKEIELKMGKLAGWMKELKDRQEKKNAAARISQEKKDRLIEEVRQHFGYVVSMKDPKFQEMLELKEREARKADKEQKKKIRFEKASEKAAATAESLAQNEVKSE